MLKNKIAAGHALLSSRQRTVWLAGMSLLLIGCAGYQDPYAYEQVEVAQQQVRADPMTRAVLGMPDPQQRTPLTGPMGSLSSPQEMSNYMQRQEADFKTALQDSGVKVERNADDIRLVMPGAITFDTGSDVLAPRFLNVLNAVAEVLKRYDQTVLSIEGHTDSRGREAYNQKLSEQRAAAVQAYLEEAGINPARMSTQGLAASQPIATNETAEGRAQNRRVELNIRMPEA